MTLFVTRNQQQPKKAHRVGTLKWEFKNTNAMRLMKWWVSFWLQMGWVLCTCKTNI